MQLLVGLIMWWLVLVGAKSTRRCAVTLHDHHSRVNNASRAVEIAKFRLESNT